MTSNTAEQKNVIGKKELRSIFLRSLSLEYSWNYERQQNMGYCFAMLPAIKKIYQKKEDQIAAKRHMEFFNTTPYISTAVFGISTAMEESNARNEDFDTSSINNVKVMPNLIPFAMTLGIYGLLQKKVKVSWILIVLMVVGIVGALLGIF